jgi:hypothetical protein
MTTVTLTTAKERPLRRLVEAAIENQLRLLQAGVDRTQERVHTFESEHGLSSETFIQRYENDEFPETLDYDEWIGEYRLLMRLKDKAETLRDIHIAD